MAHGVKVGNEYADTLGRLYARTPKAVFAAIAVSFATAGGDALDKAELNILREWTALHNAGIVSQKPPREVESELEEIDRKHAEGQTISR